jgi:putative tryptophan/tyrosine transport system substrate-binding protein
MKRREFITLRGGAAATWPLAARAQHYAKVAKVGFLYPGPQQASVPRIATILRGLNAAGYHAPEKVQLLSRVAEQNPTRLSPMAAELIENKVDAVVAVSTAAIRMVQSASATVPIVGHDLETDPVAIGLIESYARPGGNVTGVFFDFPEFRTKWLELLKEVIPTVSNVALLWDPISGQAQLNAVKAAADELGLEAQTIEVRAPTEFDRAFLAVKRQGAEALIVLSSPLFGSVSDQLADLALRHRIPTVTLFPDFARAGGLMAYGPNLLDTYRPLGVLVGKILQGAKPGDLPVERPSKFELVVNVRTARAIGLAVPTTILLRADEVIE